MVLFIFFVLRKGKEKLIPHFSFSLQYQAPLSMEFSRQEYWNGLPFPPPGDLPNLGIEPTSPALADRCFSTEPPCLQHSFFFFKHVMLFSNIRLIRTLLNTNYKHMFLGIITLCFVFF